MYFYYKFLLFFFIWFIIYMINIQYQCQYSTLNIADLKVFFIPPRIFYFPIIYL